MKKFSSAENHNKTALSIINRQKNEVNKKKSLENDMKKIVLKNVIYINIKKILI